MASSEGTGEPPTVEEKLAELRDARAIGALVFAVAILGCTALPPVGTRPQSTHPTPNGDPTPPPTASLTPTPSPPAITTGSSIPLCRDLKPATAPVEYYRDTPIYVGNPPDNEVRAWAATKPDFQTLWIDWEHNGWLTLAFTSDAAERQREIEAELPGVGAVAVRVDWTVNELDALHQRVIDELLRPGIAFSAGSGSNIGAVSIGLGVLSPEKIAAVEARFDGERVCLEGVNPADAPSDGPQPQAGDGWRLLADADGVGPAYQTGIAWDEASYVELWRTADLERERPSVDFDREVVIWFGVVIGSECPPIRMDDVVIDATRAVVYPEIVFVGFGGCTDDIHPHAYVVALERSRLPAAPFALDLDPERQVPEERTIVEVDLSAPGSTAEPGQVHPDNSKPGPRDVTPGGFVEPGYPDTYRQSAHCGLEWLGPLNHASWRTDDADSPDWIPDAWRDAIVDGEVRLNVLVTTDPPKLKATANRHTVTYEAVPEDPPGCD